MARRDLEQVAAGVRIVRLKQFSGHASLKSLEEYVELEELRQNHPIKDFLRPERAGPALQPIPHPLFASGEGYGGRVRRSPRP